MVDGRGARVDGILTERVELRLEHEQVGLDRGGHLVSSKWYTHVVMSRRKYAVSIVAKVGPLMS